MYSDQNRCNPARRANDAFLRQMIGGELTDGRLSTMPRGDCPMPSVERRESCTVCEGATGENGGSCALSDCPKYAHAPSLAMVYAPGQCWRNLLDIESALEHGSLFAELVLPFRGGRKNTDRRSGPACNGRERYHE